MQAFFGLPTPVLKAMRWRFSGPTFSRSGDPPFPR
jgi:hypothetical protein